MTARGIRGTFVDFIDDPWRHIGDEEAATRFIPDGLLVVEDGIIVDHGAYAEVSQRHPALETTEIRDRLILPGFIDGHIHVPQTRVLGAYGEQLLPWLQKWVFPEERKYSDPDYALEGTRRFFDNLLASGTTTCQAFTTADPAFTRVVFEEAARRNMRIITGVTAIDQHAPEWFTCTPDEFYEAATELIARFHGVGRALYAITPRFAYGASTELLETCRRLHEEHPEVWVHTHISENPAEVRGVLALHQDCSDYLGVYEKYGLVGPRFTGGHGVWLGDEEFARLSAAGAAVTFCPCSNLYLGSGLFRLGRVTDPAQRVRTSFGTDMGGGNRFSMLNVLEDAYKVGSSTTPCWTAASIRPDRTSRKPSATSSHRIGPSTRSHAGARRRSTSTTVSAASTSATRPTSSCWTGGAVRLPRHGIRACTSAMAHRRLSPTPPSCCSRS
jgi:guanine deaminase